MDNSDDKMAEKDLYECSGAEKNCTKQKLLSEILGYLFDSAEKNNLDNKKVNKVVKDVQYLFKKDPKQGDIKCFICEND